MKVYKKLSIARVLLQEMPLSKSGHNKFAGYKYFELGDFLPAIQKIFNEIGLVDVISFDKDEATMTIYDADDGSSVQFKSPMGSANLKGCHEVQNIGAVETYQRRYLYVTALAIVEHDALDAVTGDSKVVEAKVETKVETKKEEAPMYFVTFVDMLIELAYDCKKVDELTAIWKTNQKEIDKLKSSSSTEFKRLQDTFADIKSNLT
jgi:hypothetical protein